MKHFLVIYLFTIYAVGLSSLIINALIVKKNGNSYLRNFSGFHLSFTFLLVINTLASYLESVHGDPVLLLAFRVGEDFTLMLLSFFIVYVTHRQIAFKYGAPLNYAVLFLCVLGFSSHFIPILSSFADTLTFGLLGLAWGYSIVMSLINRKLLSRDSLERYRKLIVISLIFFPLIIGPFLLEPIIQGSRTSSRYFNWLIEYLPLLMFPLFYCCYIIVNFVPEYLKSGEKRSPVAHFEKLEPYLVGKGITSREKEITRLVLQGLSNPQIGEQLFISVPTIKKHLNNIFKKLEITSRYELMAHLSEKTEELIEFSSKQ